MCGICGVVGQFEDLDVAAMTTALAHRGPDGSGVQVFPGDPPAGLGHRRLAIIDPTPAGAQPMSYGDRWWITYNGELYNFRELRRELEAKGERFQTDCDTEVLLRMFVVHGPRMLDRLNGIFALGIWDDRERRLFLARDRLGVKPLYYVHDSDRVAFASEIKPLLPFVGRPTLDETALADYLTFLWVPDPKTAFAEISKLAPGHFAWVSGGGVSIEQYWDMRFAPEERPADEWVTDVEEAVQEAVMRQTVSDVPLGSFLSGGVDSSAIVAAMRRGGAQRVPTYTIGFSSEDLRHEIVPDDVRYARQVGRLFGTDYHEEILQPNVLELLPKAVWHLEEPVADPAAISTYLICREARKEMTVMLSGMGGDEIFAGYPRYLAYRLSRAADRLPQALRSALQRGAGPLAVPGRPGRFRGPRRNLWKYMRGADLQPDDRYLSFSSYYARPELDAVLAPPIRSALEGYDPFDRHRAYLAAAAGDELSRLLYLDAKTFLPCLNLTYTDKMSMAASVEVRVPLLDDELVDLASRIPSDLKLRGLRRKYIFKRSQERALPREIVWRRKAGFGAPVRAWLAKDLQPLVEDLLSEKTIRDRGLVDPAVVRTMWKANAAGRADYSLRLYALLSLELWCRTFLDRTWQFDQAAARAGNRTSA